MKEEKKYKNLCIPVQTREGYAYSKLPDKFYELFDELIKEVKRDGYYGRAGNLEDIVEKLESFLRIENEYQPANPVNRLEMEV